MTTITEREEKMLQLIVAGHRPKTIGPKIGLTQGSVRVYLHNLYGKLRVRDMTGAAVYYLTKHKKGDKQ